MKIATTVKPIDKFGYQLILDEYKNVIGLNFLFDKKILVKKSLRKTRHLSDNDIHAILKEYLK